METLQYTMETKLELLTKLQAKNYQRHFEMFNRHYGENKQTSKVPDVNEFVFILGVVSKIVLFQYALNC
jgi:hypothetical protein